jgi:hypothetical protein
MEEIMLNLSEFSHKLHPSGVKLLAKKSNVEFRLFELSAGG